MANRQTVCALVTLVGLVGATLVDGANQEKKSDDLEWAELFAAEGPKALTAAQSLDKMSQLYSSLAGKSDLQSLGRKYQLKTLLEASHAHESKCEPKALSELHSLIESHRDYALNMVPYLKHCEQAQLALCKKTLNEADFRQLILETLETRQPASGPANGPNPAGWNEAYAKVFATAGERLSPVKVRNLLVHMERINKRQNEQLRKLAPDVEKLVWLTDINEQRCSEMSTLRQEYQSALEKYAKFELNLVPFIKYWSEEQFILCMCYFDCR